MAARSIILVVRAMRAYQWPKNLFVFAAVIFAQELNHWDKLAASALAFCCFCAASSATYLLNDIIDVEKDRAHPDKRTRPLASGAMSLNVAAALSAMLAAAALGGSWLLGPGFAAITLFYLLLTLCYSLLLKRFVIIDVMVIAAGFVVRAMAGAIAVDVVFSNWLVVCTFLLALFLALSKRRNEAAVLEGDPDGAHRSVLQHYTVGYLDHLLMVVTAGTIITYTIYTCSPEVVDRLGTDKLYLTLPFVIYGLFRYLYLVYTREKGGDVTQTLAKDWPLGATLVLYGLACIALIYGHHVFEGAP